MKKLLYGCALFFCAQLSLAQVNEQFPSVPATTLTDQSITFPTNTKGKITLIGIAYSEKSDKDLRGWFEPIYMEYVGDRGKGFFSENKKDINVYFIPMIRGINKVAYNRIEGEMKKNVDKRLHKHIALYKGSIVEYKKLLSMDTKDKPYFYLLDPQGKIVYATSGAYTDSKMEDIIEHVDAMYDK